MRLTQAGFPVPPGFIITTAAYRQFVQLHQLHPFIENALAGLDIANAAALNQAAATIRAAFGQKEMAADTAVAIAASYARLGGAVAVRSSATAEDLPDLSFAGQQDTFLNIIGQEALQRAVIDCWSSLWTARAIGYRLRNEIAHEEAAVAVVVQQQIQSDLSGVLFTANPLTGLRHETVIDATFGLGEALVSGQVEPDHFVVDSHSGQLYSKQLGAKQIVTRSATDGGIETVAAENGRAQSLTDGEIAQLVVLGQAVQEYYGTPQDIEWAIADGKLHLLQARPITSLFPLPERSLDPLRVWFSFAAVQGMLAPMTPLGRDMIRVLFAGLHSHLASPVTPAELDWICTAGERLWIDFTRGLQNPVGNRLLGRFLELIEPGAAQTLAELRAETAVGFGSGSLSLRTVGNFLRFLLPLIGPMLRTVVRPGTARSRFDASARRIVENAQVKACDSPHRQLREVVRFIEQEIASLFPSIARTFAPVFLPGMASFGLLMRLMHDRQTEVLQVTRGLPHNVTTEMDMVLWQTAVAIRDDAESAQWFAEKTAAKLAQAWLNNSLPPVAQTAVSQFMARYGMRGIGEIDLGQPRWREQPAPIMHTLQSYLQIAPAAAPDRRFAQGAAAAETAVADLTAGARRQRAGRLRARLVRAAARRVRLLLGIRESPKFIAIQLLGKARAGLLRAGAQLVKSGEITAVDDLTFLSLTELAALAAGEAQDWQSLVAARRANYRREARRQQVPRLLLSDGRAFYEGSGTPVEDADTLQGSPVSPGLVEGTVRIIFDPRSSQLAPGEILVCKGTDPAWTPLFMVAGGLITEVGGMMTHGSVVAREYGIPAVVGVTQATRKLQNGQRIRLDGTRGQILILPSPPPPG